ncbi:hypothetical protein Tco_0336432 [Tanacetum coccineum]
MIWAISNQHLGGRQLFLRVPVASIGLTDMLSKFVTAIQASTSGSGTLPGPKAVNQDVEVTKDTMPPANNGSTEDVQPPHQFHFHHEEMMIKARKKLRSIEKRNFYEIFRDLSFVFSFTTPDARANLLRPFKNLIGNNGKIERIGKDSFWNENCSSGHPPTSYQEIGDLAISDSM